MLDSVEVVRIKLHQPDVNYRMPFAFQSRFTYPIPPIATVKGLICNLLGIKDEESPDYNNLFDGFFLAIYGEYESIIKERIWLRNISKESHINRYNDYSNRSLDHQVQHVGGIIPANIYVLHNLNLILYIYHENKDFLKSIYSAFTNPVNRNGIIHLGRAEDWLVINEVKTIEIKSGYARKIPYFSWIPDTKYTKQDLIPENYQDFFESLNGNLNKLPTFYRITKDNQRQFYKYVVSKLFEGGSFRKYNFLVDEEINNLPVIFSELKG